MLLCILCQKMESSRSCQRMLDSAKQEPMVSRFIRVMKQDGSIYIEGQHLIRLSANFQIRLWIHIQGVAIRAILSSSRGYKFFYWMHSKKYILQRSLLRQAIAQIYVLGIQIKHQALSGFRKNSLFFGIIFQCASMSIIMGLVLQSILS